VREFVELAFNQIGIDISWKGEGVKEIGVVTKVRNDRRRATSSKKRMNSLKKGDVVVEVDSKYFRPTEVDELLGDASKARKEMGWKPQIGFEELVSGMVKADLEEGVKDQLCLDSGFRVSGQSNE
jgi:GDPmannose 4,6-dehydratase